MFPQSAISYGIYYWVAQGEVQGAISSTGVSVSLPMLAASVSSLVCHPLDTLRKRLMIMGMGTSAKGAVFKPRAWLKENLKAEGVGSLMNGWSVNFARNALMLAVVSMRQSAVYGGAENK